jgi:beta-lactamase regulating signal transducer with metallopeptidase domain/outer membrane lipoprotein-sorting protein
MNPLIGMDRFFGWLLQTTWQAAVIAVIILLAQFLLRNRLSPAWRHGLWFLLVARLLMPMTPRSAVSVYNLAKWPPRIAPAPLAPPAPPGADVPAAVASWRANSPEVQPVAAQQVPSEAIPRPGLAAPPKAPPPNAAPVAAVALTPFQQIDWMALGALTWLTGALFLTLRSFWLNYRFRRRLAGCASVSNESVRQLFQECAQLLQVAERVPVIETAEVDSPAVYGVWRKRLLLPEGLREDLSPGQLRHVFLHELAHIKRRDPELNWLLGVLQILHWFNPVLWFAFARIHADRELATDDLALARTQQRDRDSYGETILKVLEGLTQRRVLPGLVGIGESKAQMKERIRAIARGGAGPRCRWAACAVAAVIAGTALTNAREESQNKGINLLLSYPTTLTAGDAVPARARAWQFGPEDIFKISRFALEVGKQLRIEAGISDVGIGHCVDGAVWAVVIPRGDGKLTSPAATDQEAIAHVWLRFHPSQINKIFPAETVAASGSSALEERMRTIADAKMNSSWQSDNNAMIPEPKDMTVDMDTKAGPRRFFIVDKDAETAQYVPAFAARSADPALQPAYKSEVDAKRASVVSVTPANGATDVESIQNLRIRFDRPMNPYCAKLEWLAGGFQLDGSIQIEPDQKGFIIPVRLTPGQEQKLVVNRDRDREMRASMGRAAEIESARASRPREGFQDADLAAANEFRWSFSTKAAAATPGAGKPRVVSVSPASGATTSVLALVEITFDRPMRPSDAMFPYLDKKTFGEAPSLLPSFEYDSAAHRFTFPALLRPDDDIRLTLRGFYSAEGAACDPVVLHYQTGTESLGAGYMEKAKAAATDPKLRKLLASMKEARARLHSGIETVQTISLQLSKSAFNEIKAQTATFKWQGADRVYADITGPMAMTKAFILGSDGQTSWLYSEDEKGEKRLDKTPASKTEREVLLADPFNLAKRPVDEALTQRGLVGLSNATLDGRPCYRVETWDVSHGNFVYATQTRWWIDQETFLPKQIVQYTPFGCEIFRFDYKDLNARLAESEFKPPVAPGGNAHPLFFEKEPAPDERRFLRISDGSDGRMSGRIGWQGPNGTTSSGLN